MQHPRSSHEHRQIVVDRLDRLGLKGDLFAKKLIEHRAVIAGSFPLQCLLDEHYEGSDIDVFIRSSHGGKTVLHPFEKWLWGEYRLKSEPHLYLIHDVIRSRKYRLPGAVINVVQVATDHLETFIRTTFDLTICQTTFDGELLRYHDATLKKIAFVVNRDGLKERKPYHLTGQHLERLQRTRGHHPNTVYQVYPDPEEILEGRLRKYRDRGFVVVDPTDPVPNGTDPDIVRESHRLLLTLYESTRARLGSVEGLLVKAQAEVKSLRDLLRTKSSGSGSGSGSESEPKSEPKSEPRPSSRPATEPIHIYTDGSLFRRGTEVYAGAGVYIPARGVRRSLQLSDGAKTNNRAELTAVIHALELLCAPCACAGARGGPVVIHTDSMYVIRTLTTPRTDDVRNADLIDKAMGLIAKYNHHIGFSHVDSHTGSQNPNGEGNRTADTLAVSGAVDDYVARNPDLGTHRVSYGKYRDQALSEIPRDYLVRLVSRDPEERGDGINLDLELARRYLQLDT